MRDTYISLEKSKDAGDLHNSHRQVQDYWSEHKDEVGRHFDFLLGRPWSESDLLLFSRLNKEPVVFHEIKASERTVLGLFIQNRYDVKFGPVEETDQDLSDVWNKLYTAIGGQQDWAFEDIDLFRQAWGGGSAYQEVYVKVSPGMEPKICTRNQNFFAVYPDPESRDLIRRRDARFIDRVSWLIPDDLLEEFPEAVTPESLEGIADFSDQQPFTKTQVHRDRTHETYDQKNGKLKVIERFFRVRKKKFYTLDKELRRMEVRKEDLGQFQIDYPGLKIYSEDSQELHLAISCPAWDATKYLFNGPYHCNPVDEQTGELIWPILEMVAEGLNGETTGFVAPQESPAKIINSMMSNILGSAKHSANTSYIRKANAFVTEAEGKKFDKHHSDNDRVFQAKDNVELSGIVVPIPKGETNADHTKALDFAMNHLKEVSSTPPALQGVTEEKGASGILNAQRIEQAYVQLQVLVANWKAFLRQRAKLVQYYVRKYYTFEKTFRIVSKGDMAQMAQGAQGMPTAPGQMPGAPAQGGGPRRPQFLTINQPVPAMDAFGRLTGAIEKVNDITTSSYDLVIEDSYQSPTYRFKTQQQISELLQSAGVQADPILMGMLLVEFVKLSDVSQDLKDFVQQHSMAAQQAAAQQQQQAALETEMANMAGMQGLAQTEAEQTFAGGPPPAGAGGMKPGGSNVPPSSASGGAARQSLARRPTAFRPAAPAVGAPV